MKNLTEEKANLISAIETYDLIYVYGPPSVGKTRTTKEVLDSNRDACMTYINCNNVTTASALYIDIVKSISRHLRGHSYKLGKISDKLMCIIEFGDFLNAYAEFVEDDISRSMKSKTRKKKLKKCFIVLDQIELFKRTPMIETLIPLHDFCKKYPSALGLILISCDPPHDFMQSIKYRIKRMSFMNEAGVVSFQHWSKEELIELILMQSPRQYPNLYNKFVHNIVTVVYKVNTKDPRELRSFCQENFEKFLQHCKKKIYERFIKNDTDHPEFEEFEFDFDDETNQKAVGTIMSTFLSSFKQILDQKDVRSWGQVDTDRRVVFNMSLMIVAVYIAAFTTPADDKRNFVRHQRRQSKKLRSNDHGDKKSRQFTMERLLHIFYSLSKLSRGTVSYDEVTPKDRPDSALSDIQLLEDLDMIHITTGDGLDSTTRYKISHNISERYVEILAKQTETPLSDVFGL